MSEKLIAKRQIYPLLGIVSVVIIMIFGLITAKSIYGFYYLIAVWLLLLFFGYWRACFAILPVAVLLCAILAGITYAISRDVPSTLAAINRIFAMCIALIPGLGMEPVKLVRCLSALKVPRMLTLGMMITINFFPLLGLEVSRVREAMKTRGAGNLLHPQIFYRAFLLPLVVRLVNISDTLSLSVETRGFSCEKDTEYSVYKTIQFQQVDVLFFVMLLILSILVVVI